MLNQPAPTEYFIDMTAIRNHLDHAGIPAEVRQISRGGWFWLYAGNQARTTGPGEPVHAPVIAVSGRMAADGHVRADVEQFRYGIPGDGGSEWFHAYSSDGTYLLTDAELADHIAELIERVADLAGLCARCGSPVMARPDGWEHLEDPTPQHLASPRFRTVARADVWDVDEATAGKYLL
jgi:hypothetical protein